MECSFAQVVQKLVSAFKQFRQIILIKVTNKFQKIRRIHGDDAHGVVKEGFKEAQTALIGLHEGRFGEKVVDYVVKVKNFISSKKRWSYAEETCWLTA